MVLLSAMVRGRRTWAIAATLIALASPAAGQRLAYDLSRPQLDYEPLDEPAAAPAPPSAEPEADGRVREVYLDQMEIGVQRGQEGYGWGVATRIGGPRHRIWLESIGEGTLGGALDYLELQALYSRAISENWDVQAGLRYDLRPTPNRAWFTIGAQGNATEQLYLGGFAFLSHRGELAARADALLDIPVAGRLVLQPSGEVNFFARDIAALGLGRGLAYGEAGLRLRYAVREWFAPYVGLEWTRDFGRTARLTRQAGEDVSGRAFLIGLRSWF
jgi:copper resistance protein B